MTERCVLTRLLEACYREAVACYSQAHLVELYSTNGRLRIYAQPLLPGEQVVPRQINIVPLPPVWTPGVGGVSELGKEIEFTFHFPVQSVVLVPGETTFLDEVDELAKWLRAGGTSPNKNGRLADPDNPGKYLNEAIRRIEWDTPQPGPRNASVVVPVIVTFVDLKESRSST
ncbi:MAG TPA: hypothetical protein VNL91_04160 [Thermoanaerobaculia bacterium]|nr:hypothetical protein [Thermoanaerobaculia bacterium]